MTKFQKRKILVPFLVLFAGSAHAQLNLPNPLIEPLSRPGAARPGAGGGSLPGLPPLPVGSSGSRSQLANDSVVSGDDGKRESALNSARGQFNGFSVSAIIGKKAVLRRQSGQGSTGGSGISQMSAGQIPMSGQAPTSAAVASLKSESLTVRDGEPFDYMVGSGTLYASVNGDRVVIYLDGESGKSYGRKEVVFSGEVQSTIAQPRAITLQTKDSDYQQALSVKANNTSGSNSSTSSDSDSGSNSNNSNNSNSSGNQSGSY